MSRMLVSSLVVNQETETTVSQRNNLLCKYFLQDVEIHKYTKLMTKNLQDWMQLNKSNNQLCWYGYNLHRIALIHIHLSIHHIKYMCVSRAPASPLIILILLRADIWSWLCQCLPIYLHYSHFPAFLFFLSLGDILYESAAGLCCRGLP